MRDLHLTKNPQESADLVTSTEESLMENFIFFAVLSENKESKVLLSFLSTIRGMDSVTRPKFGMS